MKTRTILLAAALGLSACGSPENSKAQEGVFAEQPRVVPGDASAMKASFAPVVRQAAPAVVNIAARGVQRVQSADPFFQLFGPQARVAQSVGSGVIVRPDGTVVTNYHVIEGMQQINVVLNDRREFPAEVVLADQRSDIAVLKLQGVDGALPFLRIDDQEEQQVGDLVLAIGNPFGVGQTVTNGIISALNRTETGISDSGSFIQTDAAINPGNSGGALIDMDGDLIGINTAIFSPSGASAGIGFSIPVDEVNRIVPRLIRDGRFVRPALGVAYATEPFNRALGLPSGVAILRVQPGSPAAQAGLRPGDVVVSLNGRDIEGSSELTRAVGGAKPGDTLRLEVLREGRRQTISVRSGTRPANLEVASANDDEGSAAPTNPAAPAGEVIEGLTVAPVTAALRSRFDLPGDVEGLVITAVNQQSRAGRLGFQPGMVILQANGRRVGSTADLKGAVETVKNANRPGVLLLMRTPRGNAPIVLPLGDKN